MDSDSAEQMSPLLLLPTEILLNICKFLDTKFLVQSMRLVCKRFYSILGDETVWKCRIKNFVKDTFPPLPVNEDEFSWLKAYYSIENEYNHWKNFEDKKCTSLLYRTNVNSVLLLNSSSLCISGSSDESISVWSLQKDKAQVTNICHKLGAHRDSVLGLLEKNSKLLSCSWDTTVKYWDISVGLQNVDSADCHAPVRCIATTDESYLVAAGKRRGQIEIFDVRTKLKSLKSFAHSKSCIAAMTMFGNTLLTANKTGFIAAWDMRNNKTFAEVNIKRKTNGNVTCFSYAQNVLYAGDSEGYLHLIEPRNMKLVASSWLECFNDVYGIKYTGGSIIAVCKNKTNRNRSDHYLVKSNKAIMNKRNSDDICFKFYNVKQYQGTLCVGTPTSHPDFHTYLGILSCNGAGDFDYLNGILATGYEQEYIKFMFPINQ